MLLDPNPIDFSLGSEANANLLDDTDALLYHQNPVIQVTFTIQSKLHMATLYIDATNNPDPEDQLIHVMTVIQSQLHTDAHAAYADIETEKYTSACIARL